MRCKINTIANTAFICLIVLLAFNVRAVQAQGLQNFVQNEENRIQQGSAAGLLNQNQTSNLQNQEAQIMQQEVQDANQNGGKLTPQERQQISSETRNLNQNLNYAVNKNNPNLGYQPMNQWQNGAGQGGRPWAGNPNWTGNNANYQQVPQNWQNNPNGQQFNSNGYPRHHHRYPNNYNNNP